MAAKSSGARHPPSGERMNHLFMMRIGHFIFRIAFALILTMLSAELIAAAKPVTVLTVEGAQASRAVSSRRRRNSHRPIMSPSTARRTRC